MYCSNCGTQNPEQAVHCMSCGAVLANSSPQVPPAVVLTEPRISKLALASVIMGGLTVFCVTWPIFALPAIICGIMALVEIKKNKAQLVGTFLAVAGILVPVMMTFFVLLGSAIALPAFSKARDTAKRAVCLNNLRQITLAAIIYSEESDNQLPPVDGWCDAIMPYLTESQNSQLSQNVGTLPPVFQCPEAKDIMCAYAMNENLRNMKFSSIRQPGRIVMFFEADLGHNGSGGRDDVALRHKGSGLPGCTIGFVDGHSEFVIEEQLDDLIWTVE